ncbi:DMT family transporter [Roseateles saccharophilus]|uniref:EamA domain-containing membrane protein RarD n=1 Tax=Roseateles saccharophilus TaxID=304 RepID=A0A4R3UR95_ROSSA|nr:DMT family transporter [Roseateles saccharophilus]MDG0833624.1 DMT family transporter [Roseateles saccharophilus]TCU93210.1 EamA domain-containing membrane protein RarD [Roseateles saccharophilus]
MKAFDIGELVLLAALWGASFLFMRLGAHEFGPVPLAAVRVGLASAMLVPLLASRGQLAELRTHWNGLLLVGALNSAIPFALFSFAALSITAGLSSIVNATTPLWTAVVAFVWLGQRLTPLRVLGLVIGFAGVAFLAWDKASLKPGADHSGLLAVLACATATLCYGLAANATKRFLTGVPPLAVATGSQFAATLLLALPAAWLWPAAMPGAVAWSSALGLAALCTALAYILYFRLMSRVGPTNAVSVTFLIPLFAILWGALFLHEAVTAKMVAGGAIVLVGIALALGLVGPRAR